MLNLIVAPFEQNPKAEKYTKKVVRILKQEKIEYSVYFCINPENVLTNIQELLDLGEKDFVLVGDDVLIHSFINNVKDLSKIKLGIIPVGKNKDFSNYIQISNKPTQAIKDILENNTESFDYLLVNNKTKVLNNVTVGASAEMFEIYNQYKMKNFLSKQFLMFKYGNKFEGIDLAFNAPKNVKTKWENVFELNISNAGLLNNKQVSPLSNAQDGLLNVNYALVPPMEERKKYLKKFNKGSQVKDERTKQSWKESVVVTNPDKRIKILADNKLITVEELEVKVVENGLNIYKKID